MRLEPRHSMLAPPAALVLAPRRRAAQDLAICRALLAEGSKTFAAASRLLPAEVRNGAIVLYAFCRVADDAVDLSTNARAQIDRLRVRLDRVFRGIPVDDPVDRSLCDLVHTQALAQAPFDALLEGFAWDAEGRRYADIGDVLAYAARVASSVGVLLTAMMGCRDRDALARACELGAAMQLTNIARDVAEDARRGRVYLPYAWLDAAGVPSCVLTPELLPHPALPAVVERLLDTAAVLYRRAEPGIARLPPRCRPAIWAARWIYADIGRVLARRGHTPWGGRARVGSLRKLVLLLRALRPPTAREPIDAPVRPEFQFLVDATASPEPRLQ